MIVLDTHALIWWVADPGQLGTTGRQAIEAAATTKSLYVSCISAWEVALLNRRGRLKLSLDVRDWIARCEALPFLFFVPVDNAIAVESVRLPDFPHEDPADRLIVATTLSLGASLVTKDEKIQCYPGVQTLW